MSLKTAPRPELQEITRLIEGVLRGRLQPAGFENASVEPGFDHDGDPILRVHARFGRNATAVAGRTTADLLLELRKGLAELGEDRFPQLLYEYPDPEPPAKKPTSRRSGALSPG